MFAIGKTHRKRDEFPGAGQSDWRESLPPAEERGTHVSVPLKSVGAITLFVDDPKRSKAFYEQVFDAADIYEDENSAVFRFENTIVNLVVDPAELIEPAPVGSGTTAMYTFFVDDCDAAVHELRGRGVELLNGPVDRPWGVRTAAFADPDGYAWEVAQQLG